MGPRTLLLWGVTSFVAPSAVAGTVPAGVTVFDLDPDPRLCPSPLCGGYWVMGANLPATVCVDGTSAPRCYVWDLDLSPLALSPRNEQRVRAAITRGEVLVAGEIVPWTWSGMVLGELVVHKFWWDPTAP